MKQIIGKIGSKAVSLFGFQLSAKPKPAKPLSNVFKTRHNKTALLCYIKDVFLDQNIKNDQRHTNRYTTYLIAELLGNLGYNVDVADITENVTAFENYNLILGMGRPLENALKLRSTPLDGKKMIWFGTGCNPLFSNVVTLQRLSDVYQRHKLLMLSSVRYVTEDWPLQHEIADHIILHGRTFARSTYRSTAIDSINAPVFMPHNVVKTKSEWETSKKNYLWFGVGGLVHKGLDLVIEAFEDQPDVHLHICGSIEHEKEFCDYYQPRLQKNPAISYHGFVNVSSDAFVQVLKACAFVIFPSASEGNSPSVITCMANGGLIPIVTKNADVDLDGFGVVIEELSVEAVKNAIVRSQQLPVEEIKLQSEKCRVKTRTLNTFDNFKNEFTGILKKVL